MPADEIEVLTAALGAAIGGLIAWILVFPLGPDIAGVLYPVIDIVAPALGAAGAGWFAHVLLSLPRPPPPAPGK